MVVRADGRERSDGVGQSRRRARYALLLLAMTACTPVLPEELDSGPTLDDAGRDSGPIDPGQDSGVDAGGPGTDAGPVCDLESVECEGVCVDLNTAADHCGECGNACPIPDGTVPVCASGSCGAECATGRADCNEDLANGCEVNTEGDPLHCGGCDIVCETGRLCREGRCRPDPLWARTFGDVDNDLVQGVAVDSVGNVYLTGSFQGSVNFGGSILTSAGWEDVFVASYGPDGAHRWSLRAGGSGGSEEGTGIAVDGDGNVYVSGLFRSASFGGPLLESEGGLDVFVASFTSAGVHRWSLRGGGTLDDSAGRIAVDPAGNVYVVGLFQGNANFGGLSLTSAGSIDMFVASYTSSGAHRWSLRGGGTNGDNALGVATDASGNSFVVGRFQGTASFGGLPLTSAGDSDVFVASFSTAGTHLWSMRAGGTGRDVATSIAVDGAGDLYLAGYFDGMASFGGTALVSAGGPDAWAASYTASGVHRWSLRGGGAGFDYAHDIAVDPRGRVHVVGDFSGSTASFGGPPLDGAGAFLGTYSAADGAYLASLRLDGGGFERAGVGVGSSALCTVSAFVGNFRFAGETFIASGSADGFVACFEP